MNGSLGILTDSLAPLTFFFEKKVPGLLTANKRFPPASALSSFLIYIHVPELTMQLQRSLSVLSPITCTALMTSN